MKISIVRINGNTNTLILGWTMNPRNFVPSLCPRKWEIFSVTTFTILWAHRSWKKRRVFSDSRCNEASREEISFHARPFRSLLSPAFAAKPGGKIPPSGWCSIEIEKNRVRRCGRNWPWFRPVELVGFRFPPPPSRTETNEFSGEMDGRQFRPSVGCTRDEGWPLVSNWTNFL